MKIVISPAKSLSFEEKAPLTAFTQGLFLNEAEKLSSILKKKSAKVLSKLMDISENLGQLNFERNQNWAVPFTLENAKQAVFAFKGGVYIGLDVASLPENRIDSLQDKLRILSGQYGILKPLDLIQPYRLEMGTKLKVGRKDNLYQYWGESITKALNEELSEDELFINLASNEYFKVFKTKLLKVPVITPVFKDYKNGKLKVISFFAKKARGMMVRYILEHNIETIKGLKGFNSSGYVFDESLSSGSELIFTR
jgi:cytoplasmic iron level regulating protein YaaA (DUF328/UPF0246 family)